jgi:Rrf2 family protein
MLQVNARVDYGLLLMLSLATQWGKQPVSLRSLADERRLPYRFLSQIVIPLRKQKLVRSREGVRGGYQLSRSPKRITVGEVLKALEGDVRLVPCLAGDGKSCPNGVLCTLFSFWRGVSAHLRKALDTVTLADLARETTRT